MDFEKDLDLVGAKERFMKNEGLYKKFLFRFPEENRYDDLEEQVKAGNAEQAFQVAHTMKGVVGNLSLLSVSEVLNPIVEVLRSGGLPEEEKMNDLKEACDRTVEVVRYIKENDVSLF
ncbi:MAG: Hpt domain-containing protein [Bacteroidales bacterium]|nr:Hpt domain-containing protein [Clostridium sp.]MCM1204176.1 Hpt domain-containing protein [Bacteroidales bacterium]